MIRSLAFKIILGFFIFFFILFLYFQFKQNKSVEVIEVPSSGEDISSSNIIKDVSYKSKDAKGNEYVLDASKGQIDITNSKIIFLTDVRAIIKLNNSNLINITSNFGKYNIDNYDTIFSKNVIIKYIENEITGDYLDFSLKRSSMIMSKNVVYTNNKNILKSDVIEINLETKDTKIFMYEQNNKVNIKSKK
tara:strand:+ start:905 stop:1477 length:573 start_codon:yes stop_codon:yes gene_type:complete